MSRNNVDNHWRAMHCTCTGQCGGGRTARCVPFKLLLLQLCLQSHHLLRAGLQLALLICNAPLQT